MLFQAPWPSTNLVHPPKFYIDIVPAKMDGWKMAVAPFLSFWDGWLIIFRGEHAKIQGLKVGVCQFGKLPCSQKKSTLTVEGTNNFAL